MVGRAVGMITARGTEAPSIGDQIELDRGVRHGMLEAHYDLRRCDFAVLYGLHSLSGRQVGGGA